MTPAQDVPIDVVVRPHHPRWGRSRWTALLADLCVRKPEGGLRYIDVWETEEQCARAFQERLHPAVDGHSAAPRRP